MKQCTVGRWEERWFDGWVSEQIEKRMGGHGLGVLKCLLLCHLLKDVILVALKVGEGTQEKECGWHLEAREGRELSLSTC